MFKQILVALKFTPASMFALETGIRLARKHAAKLHIFHAIDYRLQEQSENDAQVLQVKNDISNRYETEIKPRLGDLENVTFKCLPSDPALEVCKIARNMNVDLIILGCHQLPEKMCLGRVDYIGITILEKAPCPVMLVPLCE